MLLQLTRPLISVLTAAVLAIGIFGYANISLADGGHSSGPDIGKPGKASAAGRTVEIMMGDMYYEPGSLSVKAGETVRFVVRNTGQLLHEFNLGTAAMHADHRKKMAAMLKSGALTPTALDHSKMHHGAMKHDDPNSVLLEPGQTAELTWTFSKAGELQYACNIPGHSEAGMLGNLSIGHGH